MRRRMGRAIGDEGMAGFLLHGLIAALGDDDGFGEAILRAAAAGVNEVLDKAEAKFERGSAVV